MKKDILKLLNLAAVLVTLTVPTQAAMGNERSIIELSSQKWVDTYNSNDWHALAELFTPDATMMPPNSQLVQGREAIANWQAKNESGFRIAFDIRDIHLSGNIAYVRGRSCVFIPLGDGEYGVDVGKFLEVRKKQANGEWLIHADIFNSDGAVGSDLLPMCPFFSFE
ncbi:YybH family protein [Brumicola pallidula]|uniref:DUF4440 domain-containing protein n=1 Tax=Brumicola pallidula DSM 14239 = ACAM 615 TaxID=1121922 RepID=K6ZAF2_9ALTE|nr:SgcJ/EcaC family oxidoreductase [Glaciecola pallidula]GAC27312.1 hypothetical protein GPAL_0432 [Glaciecola pallidula DSM 14239 = ACAM 615]